MKKRRLWITLITLLIFVALSVQPALATGSYVVQSGDTLASIAAAYGVSISQLASANGLNWNSWVYTGQTLAIPGQSGASTAYTGSGGGSYTVQPGDTLYSIAVRHGVSTAALQSANSLSNANFIYSGQRLVIPGGSGAYPAASYGGEKWIDVNLSNQTLTAYQGQTPVYSTLVSTGLWNTPTVVGTFRIYVKHYSTLMTGGSGASYYYLPNVPYVMYFYGGYGLHGTYWHNNFGAPMSHGCVNLSVGDAAWIYNWASVGTRVVTHY